MTYKLFLDDERDPPNNGETWIVARTSNEAIDVIRQKGIPSFMSLDHDLGGDDTCIEFLKKFEIFVLDGDAVVPEDFDFYVHSQNPVGKQNIEHRLNGFLKFLKQEST